jgi:hypothetical protein
MSWQQVRPSISSPAAAAGASEIKCQTTVKKLQRKLEEFGYFFDKIDGVSWPGTRDATIIYQHTKGLQEDVSINLSAKDMI